MMNFRKTAAGLTVLFVLCGFLSSCYSIFSGGASGMIVDAESISAPKAGIANVQVYAYTDSGTRDSDFNKWNSGNGLEVFTPGADYYAHTSTAADGSFNLSKILWKKGSFKSKYGKDADISTVYLLFYHENYGLSKGQAIIVSDSSSNSIYEELTAVRKTTVLTMSFIDVASNAVTGNSVFVQVDVPQKSQQTAGGEVVPVKTYRATVAGEGVLAVSYPRWESDADKAAGKEAEPEVSIKYSQSADSITWKACSYPTAEAPDDYSFLPDDFILKRQIKNSAYSINLPGKSTVLSLPTFSGTCGDTSAAQSDGVIIGLKCCGSTSVFYIDCGEVTTYSDNLGTTSQEKHGLFTGLGAGYGWIDTSYTGKYVETQVQFVKDGSVIKTMTVRSDTASYNVQL